MIRQKGASGLYTSSSDVVREALSLIECPRFIAELAEIWDYIADDSEAHADAFVDTIDQKIYALAEQPNMGRLRTNLICSASKVESYD
ncbi:type II toxin-antitoxin system RelE/ParE family toxin [Gloeobacter morelensis MG652769]|uniref:Type II toxin-antitoxin system RelE/ParE family toxin n=2 Tax=Gloeobacter TaxID=33071 RepID=A0ABY3PTL4_9CYAN|nr:type II toxin-antitoxin system RelE/ParE family toxin [Gloeobacter morelensis MG652769]